MHLPYVLRSFQGFITKDILLAIIFTYMILAAILNSFIHPITISSAIFTSFAGVFLFLFFMNSSMNIASMLGIFQGLNTGKLANSFVTVKSNEKLTYCGSSFDFLDHRPADACLGCEEPIVSLYLDKSANQAILSKHSDLASPHFAKIQEENLTFFGFQ